METAILSISLFLFLMVLVGAMRSVLERRWPFLRRFDDAKQAYIVLAIAAAVLFTWVHFGNRLQIKSVEIGGVKADIVELKQKVATLSEQMELFFKSKRIEVFNQKNWNQVRKVGASDGSVILEVTLEQEPIRNSIEVFEGVLLLPEQEYEIEGRILRFSANTDKPVNGLTIKYYPRIHNDEHADR